MSVLKDPTSTFKDDRMPRKTTPLTTTDSTMVQELVISKGNIVAPTTIVSREHHHSCQHYRGTPLKHCFLLVALLLSISEILLALLVIEQFPFVFWIVALLACSTHASIATVMLMIFFVRRRLRAFHPAAVEGTIVQKATKKMSCLVTTYHFLFKYTAVEGGRTKYRMGTASKAEYDATSVGGRIELHQDASQPKVCIYISPDTKTFQEHTLYIGTLVSLLHAVGLTIGLVRDWNNTWSLLVLYGVYIAILIPIVAYKLHRLKQRTLADYFPSVTATSVVALPKKGANSIAAQKAVQMTMMMPSEEEEEEGIV